MGKLNITRSKRHCMPWTQVKNNEVNVSNFPDPSMEDATNYCRNPTKSITGCWCYTNDSNVPTDSCLIRDCDKPCKIMNSRSISDFT